VRNRSQPIQPTLLRTNGIACPRSVSCGSGCGTQRTGCMTHRRCRFCFRSRPVLVDCLSFLWVRLWHTPRRPCGTQEAQGQLSSVPGVAQFATGFRLTLPAFPGQQCAKRCPTMARSLGQSKTSLSKHRPVAFLSIVCHNHWQRKSGPNIASSRLALRAEFQSYFRVVITFRGARVMRRNRQAAYADVRCLPVSYLMNG